MYYVYILKCSDGSFYTGIAKDIKMRLKKHKEGKGSKYVRSRSPFTLVHSEEKQSKSEAMKREFEIKQMRRPQKLEVIGIIR